MKYTRLGRTGARISAISLGTVEIGLDYGIGPDGQARRPSEEDAARLLHGALDLGINLIDTARAYGESEAIIGRVLKDRRDEYLLCSKVLVQADEPEGTLCDKVTQSVEASLRALGTDRIDVMMIHSAPLEVLRREDLISIFEDLRDAGKFRWIGASVYGEEAALYAIRCGRFDCLQVASSALDKRPEARIWPEAEQHDVGIVARSVLLKGVLTSRSRYLPDRLSDLRTAAEEMEKLADSADLDLVELAYRYVLSGPLPHTALVGASNLDEVESAVRFAEAGPLPPEIVDRVRSIAPPEEEHLNPATWGID